MCLSCFSFTGETSFCGSYSIGYVGAVRFTANDRSGKTGCRLAQLEGATVPIPIQSWLAYGFHAGILLLAKFLLMGHMAVHCRRFAPWRVVHESRKENTQFL